MSPPDSGPRGLRPIFGIAFPVTLALGSQVLVSVVDAALIGGLGEAELGAVGQGGWAIVLAASPLMGFSAGVQAMVARRRGEGAGTPGALQVLVGGLLLTLAFAAVTVGITWAVAPFAFAALNPEADVVQHAIPYTRIRVFALFGVAVGMTFRGYWNASNLSWYYLATQVASHVVNIVVSFLLVQGWFGLPQLGVTGVAIGSVLGPSVGALVSIGLGFRHAGAALIPRRLPGGDVFQMLLKLGIPTSVQQGFAFVAMNILFMVVANMGKSELASATLLMSLVLLTGVPITAIGIAATSLVSQSLGAKDTEAAARWGRDACAVAVALVAILAVPMMVVPDLFLSGFLEQDSPAFALSRVPLQLAGLTALVDAIGIVLLQGLLGAGAAGRVMIVNVVVQTLSLVGAAVLGLGIGASFLAVWSVFLVGRWILAGIFSAMWVQGSWKTIRV